jgi:hypothetical protein
MVINAGEDTRSNAASGEAKVVGHWCRWRRVAAMAGATLVVIAVAALGGCSPYQISDRSVDFNSSLQDLDNRQVLLNAVRASKRYPPYFTSVNQISSSGELDGSQVNFTLPFGPQNHNIYNAAPMIKFQTGITMQTNPLDTQEFYEGYMTPTKISLVGYYIDQGWPYQLIYHAFIQTADLSSPLVNNMKAAIAAHCEGSLLSKCDKFRISNPDLLRWALDPKVNDGTLDCRDVEILDNPQLSFPANQKNVHFNNSPGISCRFAKFQMLSAMLDILRAKVGSKPSPAGGMTPVEVPTTDKNVSIKIQNTTQKEETTYGFAMDGVNVPCAPSKPPAEKSGHAGHSASQSNKPAEASKPAFIGTQTYNPVTATAATEQGSPQQVCSGGKFVIRSPEAMVFYLGQIISADIDTQDVKMRPSLAVGSHTHPLFAVEKGTVGGASALVSVSVDSENYSIRKEGDYNNSMHFLTLAEQVIALQKKGTQIPGIAPVQVINP